LPDGREWLWRPVLHPGLGVRPIELYDGTYDLGQIAEMNEIIDIEEENTWRAHEAMMKKNG
jgi:hypothetical protein